MNALKKITAKTGLAKAAKELAAKGKKGDTDIAHVTKGDLVWPLERIDAEVIEFANRKLGKDLPRFVVGSPHAKKNSDTGLEAFEDGGDGSGDGSGGDGDGSGGGSDAGGGSAGGPGAGDGGSGTSDNGPFLNPFAPPPPAPAPAPVAAPPPAPVIPPTLNPAAISGVATAPTSVPATAYNSNALMTYLLGGGQAARPLQNNAASVQAPANSVMPLNTAPPGAPPGMMYTFGAGLQNALSGITGGNLV